MQPNYPYHPASRPFSARTQSGQAIIIIAVMMVGLIGALGLAIDGGGLFFLRRDTQNAVDAALLAAAYAQCAQDPTEAAAMSETAKNALVVEAALDAAERNGFVDTDPAANAANRIDVQVNRGPTSGPKQGDTDYVEVIIRANKPSYFIQLVWGGQLSATSRGVSYCSAARDTTPAAGIMALGDCGGTNSNPELNWSGSNIDVIGGMLSNGTLNINNNNSTDSNLIEGGARANDEVIAGNTNFNPPSDDFADVDVYDPLEFNISDFRQSGRIGSLVPSELYHLAPGSGDWNLSDGDLIDGEMKGLYVNFNGGITLPASLTYGWSSDPGATIVASGQINISGEKGLSYEYYHGLDDTDNGAKGLILFSALAPADPCDTNNNAEGIDFSGGRVGNDNQQGNNEVEEFVFHGIVYAPTSAISWSLSSYNIRGAIIGYTISGSGSDFNFEFDPSLFPPRPPMLEMAE
jgi:hypothetical protein